MHFCFNQVFETHVFCFKLPLDNFETKVNSIKLIFLFYHIYLCNFLLYSFEYLFNILLIGWNTGIVPWWSEDWLLYINILHRKLGVIYCFSFNFIIKIYLDLIVTVNVGQVKHICAYEKLHRKRVAFSAAYQSIFGVQSVSQQVKWWAMEVRGDLNLFFQKDQIHHVLYSCTVSALVASESKFQTHCIRWMWTLWIRCLLAL